MQVDLTNTPGIYYAISYWIYAQLYLSFNAKRTRGIKRSAIAVFALVFICLLMTMTHRVPVIFFIPLVLLDVFLIGLYIYVQADVSVTNAAYLCVKVYLLGEFAASLEWQLFYFGLTRMGVPLSMLSNLVFMPAVHGVVFAFAWFWEKNFGGDYRKLEVSGSWIAGVLIIAAATFAASNLSYVISDTPFTSRYPAEIFLIRTLFDLAGCALLFGFHLLHLQMEEELRARTLEQVIAQQRENYRLAEASVDLVNQKYHDLKHQIQILKNESAGKDRQDALTRMEQEIEQFEALRRTGNDALDTVLTSKSITCQKRQITMITVADGALLDFMDPLDVGALFGNALDNAIEAVERISDPEQRLIRLKVSRQKGFARILVENRYEGDLVLKDGYPVTSKEDARYHGFGVRSMEKTAEKYGGSFRLGTDDGWFRVSILLPIPQDKKTEDRDAARTS